ncbi:transglutaminase-like predicted protease domain fused ChW-repeats and cell-adhesion domain [Roseburia sp. CAG:309]|nr:transglutaminase-like predicted protease domain fused ChW-repeats and cell-adhesion domain [Roseburia sp. CAG:309]
MKKGICKLILFCALLVLTGLIPERQTNAAEEYTYYITFNQIYQYEITKEQFESIRGNWNSLTPEGVLEIARQIVPEDQIPSHLTNIGIRAVPKNSSEGELPAYPSDKTENLVPDNGFVVSQGVLLRYEGKEEVVTIPDTVTSIYQGAFMQNAAVKKVIIPSSVKNISNAAFYQCPNLQFIVCAGKAASVGEYMVYQCESIVNMVAPKSSKEYAYAKGHDIPVVTSEKTVLEAKTLHLLKGDKQTVKLYNALGTIRWKSSAPAVVSVDARGKLLAKRAGKAKITAQFGGKKYTLTVQVQTKSEDKRVDQVIKTVIKKGMSAREKVKAVHNWLIRNVKYDYHNYLRGTVPHVSHTSKGALVRGLAVCDGYSKAFMKIMKKLKIPCKMIAGVSEGGGHAWNLVKVGGKWLHVDVTFDDPIVNGKNTNTRPRYTYFLKTDAQMRKDHAW